MNSNQRSYKGIMIGLIIMLAAFAGGGAYFSLYPEYLPKWVAKTTIGQELQTTTVYKWQDASGDWHVSDQPPQEGVKYQVERYTRDTNVLPVPQELQR